jgi:hypothetical protein
MTEQNDNMTLAVYKASQFADFIVKLVVFLVAFLANVTVALYESASDFAAIMNAMVDDVMNSEFYTESRVKWFFAKVGYEMRGDDAEVLSQAFYIWWNILCVYLWWKVTFYFYRTYFKCWIASFRMARKVATSVVNLCVTDNVTQILDSNGNLLGQLDYAIKPEKAIPSSDRLPSDRMSALVELRNLDGMRVGYGFRVGMYICTATHVRDAASWIVNPYNDKRAFSIHDSQLIQTAHDVTRIKFTDGQLSRLGVRSVCVSEPKNGSLVYVPDVVNSAGKPLSYRTAGAIQGEYDSEALPMSFLHTASTYPGVSGAPVMSRNKVVGVHIGAHRAKELNVAAAIHTLFTGHSEESSLSTQERMFSHYDELETNRKSRKTREKPTWKQPEIQGKPWADYESDEELFFETTDFRSGPEEVGASERSVITSSPVIRKSSSMSMLDSTSTKECSSSAVVISEKESSTRSLSTLRCLDQLQKISQRSQTIPSLPRKQTPTVSSLPSSTAEVQSQNPGLAEKKQRKRRRKRTKPQLSQSGLKQNIIGSPTSTTPGLDERLSNLSCEVSSLKSLLNQLLVASSTSSAPQIKQC